MGLSLDLLRSCSSCSCLDLARSITSGSGFAPTVAARGRPGSGEGGGLEKSNLVLSLVRGPGDGAGEASGEV
ncbi:hypothetical protein DPMN_104522 [Dreissena polymorpha]|uniref:Uncharacterized protein n=1 Tax=Dreissena polymorpha TaxID=45954 RepID=A0A9D4K052_DREPO|nr:hypothetical protein DPMN_104522 [Dreissena polymorpha]